VWRAPHSSWRAVAPALCLLRRLTGTQSKATTSAANLCATRASRCRCLSDNHTGERYLYTGARMKARSLDIRPSEGLQHAIDRFISPGVRTVRTNARAWRSSADAGRHSSSRGHTGMHNTTALRSRPRESPAPHGEIQSRRRNRSQAVHAGKLRTPLGGLGSTTRSPRSATDSWARSPSVGAVQWPPTATSTAAPLPPAPDNA
jgi:hypothetical protein